ncbi:6-phosphogluconolactonase (cycloisomerase 2 family) [Novosphingobium sp. SG751A]|uniref:lactonase family protein n=1 Tax=Novosphingobium sp. SG751A TaxID=2587000 RepID=UPI001553B341|nr:beta-propeller fold lactonase family protein [Novosphingobium sp. SG751A]NOW45279.1 6-phosphogluconolactonase (cycloisomerase 2 family) [Novosphingobium sp. SG751A]
MTIQRRDFSKGLAAVAALASAPAIAAAPRRAYALYAATGSVMAWRSLNTATGASGEVGSITLPSPIQYAWPHPDSRFLYVATSDAPGGSVGGGSIHRLVALKIGRGGALSPHGEPVLLSQRPVHMSVDSSGHYALCAYNAPANLSVHTIRPDGTLGEMVAQVEKLDLGIYAHQIRMMPGGKSVLLVTRGNNASATKPEDPGALKTFDFDHGHLHNAQSIAVGGRGGLGYGPRHADFHPYLPIAYVAIERQNQLHTHRIIGAHLAPEPELITSTTDQPPQDANGATTLVGAIHVHPRGHTLYVSNRASSTVEVDGRKVFAGGDNSIAVFALHPRTGLPKLVQRIDPRGFHVRSFAISPDGRMLAAASMVDMPLREGGVTPAGLSLFRIRPDGTLAFLRKIDTPVGKESQLWTSILPVPA